MRVWKKLTATLLAASMMVSGSAVGMMKAAAADNGGKYIKEVYIAYGGSEEEATQYLKDHGWEPVKGNFNKGKSKTAAVMGIHRTNNQMEAITDIALMNMGLDTEFAPDSGIAPVAGYSFTEYSKLLAEKRVEINEFINSFLPAIKEYRENYNKKDDSVSHKRAVLVHDMLNMYFDGAPDGMFAVNDTGMPLGDLLLNPLKQEKNFTNDQWNKMSKNERAKYGDLQQIILEGNQTAVLGIETALSMATDTDEDGWLVRLEDLSGVRLSDLVELYVPSTAGQNLSNSAAQSALESKYGDTAKLMMQNYYTVQSDMLWMQDYLAENELLPDNYVDDAAYAQAINDFMYEIESMNTTEEQQEEVTPEENDMVRCYSLLPVYEALRNSVYEGDWGDTLLDFFCETDEAYGTKIANFLPLAVSLSDGQRASLQFMTFENLLRFGYCPEDAMNKTFNDMKAKAQSTEAMSVYTGVIRAIYRDMAVALTNRAAMEAAQRDYITDMINGAQSQITMAYVIIAAAAIALVIGIVVLAISNPYVGLALMGVGTMLMVTTITSLVKGLKAAKKAYYDRQFTPIPNFIVDEADIVSYTTDANGNEKKNIQFDQFVYYQAVQCNRRDIGISKYEQAQGNVNLYEQWGCLDLADLNCDVGKQWLVPYVVRSPKKGDPILADSLCFVMSDSKKPMPANCNGALHMFCLESPANVADEAYCYDSDKPIYLFWKSSGASETSSAFTGGLAALSGLAGIVVGAVATGVAMKGKKKETPDAPATTA
ncbi:MAG: hypothetical protein J5851_09225 [Oscillospiraceae bacterium]|nr:hypothetical protein [Oscillospiraceae bacterium]